jgi:hypothetical protein
MYTEMYVYQIDEELGNDEQRVECSFDISGIPDENAYKTTTNGSSDSSRLMAVAGNNA